MEDKAGKWEGECGMKVLLEGVKEIFLIILIVLPISNYVVILQEFFLCP
jgi:hypothetical protein